MVEGPKNLIAEEAEGPNNWGEKQNSRSTKRTNYLRIMLEWLGWTAWIICIQKIFSSNSISKGQIQEVRDIHGKTIKLLNSCDIGGVVWGGDPLNGKNPLSSF